MFPGQSGLFITDCSIIRTTESTPQGCLKIRRPITMSRLNCRWVARTPATTLCSSSSWWVESRRQSCVSSKRSSPHTNRGHRWVESYSALFSSITADNKNRINRPLSGWPYPRITWGQCRKREQELNVVLYFEGHLSLSVFNRRISSFSDDSFVHF